MIPLYDQLCLMKNLKNAYRKARKGKVTKWYVKEFDANAEKNLVELQKELLSGTYEPRPMKTFIIRDPKTRVISASNFRDRIVHHALCNVIEPIFEKAFIHDSYANRKGKGTHAALERFDRFKRKVSKNGLLLSQKDNNIVCGYVLKADIKHYFDSVDHEVMMRTIRRKIPDDKILCLIRRILYNYNSKILGKGMPIGNLTSQFFANVYLNELDYFVKHKLRVKYYVRYVDDFVILHESREILESYKIQISGFLNNIKLELHPQKSKIVPLCSGIKLLGFRVFYKYRLPKKGSISRIIHRIDYFLSLYNDGIISKGEILRRIDGWNAYAMHANTYKLRESLMESLAKKLDDIDKDKIQMP
ncbi:MAG TPA: hypothetical protein HA230_03990 [Candidatus Aenigmarchaeota archaeon]|nr:hypothetical protein [Candidatus Aenigmarchaeota archaeon]